MQTLQSYPMPAPQATPAQPAATMQSRLSAAIGFLQEVYTLQGQLHPHSAIHRAYLWEINQLTNDLLHLLDRLNDGIVDAIYGTDMALPL